MTKTKAHNDRKDNDFIDVRHQIYQGDTCKVWKDPDFNNLYFVQNHFSTFELPAEDIVYLFGELPA